MDLGKAEVERYLTIIRAIGREHRLTDLHMHPFEVVFGAGRYTENQQTSGIWSTADLCYLPPGVGDMELTPQTDAAHDVPAALQERLAMLGLRRLYVHTGPRCFGDQLLISGISRGLLLPVTRAGSNAEKEMALLARIFADDPRFLLGYSIPVETADADIAAKVFRAIQLWGIRAIKVHPCLSGINLCTVAGVSRIEVILAAAGRAGLPVIIHGGTYPNIIEPSAPCFGLLENMNRIDFNLTPYPVVIAHAGAFGLDRQQVESLILPRLETILRRYDHLSVDVSALSAEIIGLVLSRIAPERIVFGSDALYELPWKSLIRLFVALETAAVGPAEELLVRIAATNSDHILRKETKENDDVAANQVFPVH
jgi:predicted TIM-barrel fold metal-dependent hydrolase